MTNRAAAVARRRGQIAGATQGLDRGRALDLGCGRGYALEALVELGFDAVGVDVDVDAVAECADVGLAAEVSDDLVGFVQRQETGAVSFVVITDVLEHLPAKLRYEVLAAVADSLARAGRVLITTPNASAPLSSHRLYGDATHLTSFTQGTLSQLVESCGFRNVTFVDSYVRRPSLRLWDRSSRRSIVKSVRRWVVRGLWRQIVLAQYGDEGLPARMSCSPDLVCIAEAPVGT